MTIAWFSPLPPGTSGIAAYSDELLPLLRARGRVIDAFTADTARDFVWKHRRNPYELTVYQMGNAACHDYMWAYLFRYPGLVVLHDAQLHQARALWLTKRWRSRRDDYLAEFRANHPDAPADAGELIAAGLGGSLYQHWPLIRLVIESARLTVVHNRRLMEDLQQTYPAARVTAIEMGVSDPLLHGHLPGASCPMPAAPGSAEWHDTTAERRVHEVPDAGQRVRRKHGMPADAIVVAAFGGITPEKRIGPLIRALGAMADRHPRLHLMLVGSAATHYDVVAEARRSGVSERVHLTGYVPDAELADYLLASDVCACLRWPTNRETSASWLRCLAAGRATLITDLAHLGDVPTVDPRGWHVLDTDSVPREPVAVSIGILDEDHSLRLALGRLASDDGLRARLGQVARRWWAEHHQLGAMADAYQHVLSEAMALPAPRIQLPPHLTADGTERGRAIVTQLGVSDRVADVLGG